MLEKRVDRDIFISFRIRLARNLKNYPFVNRAPSQILKEIKDRIKKAINKIPFFNDFWRIDPETLDPIERGILAEERWISFGFACAEHPRYLFLSPSKRISIMVNEEDHLRLQFFTCENGKERRKYLEKIIGIDRLLEKELPFAVSMKWGYLTACPTNLGTGLRASVCLHLPALGLTGRIKEIAQRWEKEGWEIRGIFGEGTPGAGNLFQITNRYTLGWSEEEILEGLEKKEKEIKEEELVLRAWLLKEGRIEWEDKFMRALALLRFAPKLNTYEALEYLSILWLASVFGIINLIEDESMKRLFLEIQPFHLQRREGRNLTPVERDILRAEYIRESIFRQVGNA